MINLLMEDHPIQEINNLLVEILKLNIKLNQKLNRNLNMIDMVIIMIWKMKLEEANIKMINI